MYNNFEIFQENKHARVINIIECVYEESSQDKRHSTIFK
jgi:hypothetical protein